MRKVFSLVIIMVFMLLQCGSGTVSGGGGGASETVATAYIQDGSLRIAVASDRSFTVTVQVCSDSFSPFNMEYFHMMGELTEFMPEWVVPPCFDEPVSVIVSNLGDGTATSFHFSWETGTDDRSESKSLVPSGAVSGVVSEALTDGGSSSAAAGITVFLRGTFFWTTADNGGQYHIAGIPEGNYTLDASREFRSKENYYQTTELITVAISADTTVVVDFNVIQH